MHITKYTYINVLYIRVPNISKSDVVAVYFIAFMPFRQGTLRYVCFMQMLFTYVYKFTYMHTHQNIQNFGHIHENTYMRYNMNTLYTQTKCIKNVHCELYKIQVN